MIDFTLEDVLELARQAELQKRVEADGVKAPEADAFPAFCVVELLRAVLDDDGLVIPAGAQGTVLDPVANGTHYIVEFTDPVYQNRDRLGLATLPPDAMHVVWVPEPSLPPLHERAARYMFANGFDGRRHSRKLQSLVEDMYPDITMADYVRARLYLRENVAGWSKDLVPIPLPEDLRGKLGEAEAEGDACDLQ